jgi:hypothetical protein
VISALGEMKQSNVRWESAGTANTGVLVSDTMMFQRADPNPSDANLGSFHGLALPLLKRGVPVEAVQIESALAPGFLDRYKLLLLTYEGQKPPKPEFHQRLAEWVRNGGALVVIDDDGDPYNAVREWWNSPPHSYANPRQHLFAALGLPPDLEGTRKVGKGVIVRRTLSPAALTYQAGGADTIRAVVREAAAAVKLPWKETNSLVLRRGPYLIAAGLDESVPNTKPRILHGRYINLFDPELTVLNTVTVRPGSRMLLFDLDTARPSTQRVVAAAARVRDEKTAGNVLSFRVDGIGGTNGVLRVTAKQAPREVTMDGRTIEASRYDFSQGTVRLRFPNSPDPVAVEIRF